MEKTIMALSNDEILEAIASLTVQQAADLVKAMEEKFIPIETKEDKEKEEKDKNKDSKCKEEKPEKLLSLATKKRKAKDIKKKYFLTSPRKIRKIFDWKISNFPKYQKANKANLYSNYTTVGMTESEQIIMACYNYLQINDNLKEGDSVNLNIFDYDIIIKLIERYPNLVAVINGETLTLYYSAREKNLNHIILNYLKKIQLKIIISLI